MNIVLPFTNYLSIYSISSRLQPWLRCQYIQFTGVRPQMPAVLPLPL